MSTSASDLRAGLAEAGRWLDMALDGPQLDRFAALVELLVAGNRRLNLTADATTDELLHKHLVDALVHWRALAAEPGETIVDIGSGAGLPGLGLAILGPECDVVLVESHQRRADFSREAAAGLGLSNVTVLPHRVEEVGRDPVWREHCRRATARRLAELSILLEYTLPLLAVGGRAVFAKGEKLEEELAAAAGVSELLGGGPPSVLAVPLPPPSAAAYGAETRRFVVVTKVAPTPDTYPRRPGKPAKQPLRTKTT